LIRQIDYLNLIMKKFLGNVMTFPIVSVLGLLSSCSAPTQEVLPSEPAPPGIEVSAGHDRQIALPISTVVIEGSVRTLPQLSPTLVWSQVSGQPNVRMQGANSQVLTVSELQPGTFVFRLSAQLGGRSASDDVVITVLPAPAGGPGQGQMARLRQVAWSASDYQQWEYDATGRPIGYTAQWLASQDGSVVRRLAQQLQYDAQGRLARVVSPAGTIVYAYDQQGQVAQTEERDARNEPFRRTAYTYAAGRLVGETIELLLGSGEWVEQRSEFSYDAQGNLATLAHYALANGQLQVISTIAYSEYDGHPNPDHLGFRRPFLPGMIFQPNNPGRKVERLANGQVSSDERYTYTYAPSGHPVQRTTSATSHGTSWTSTLHYHYE
jgi:YD repeat-containing protein